MRTLTLKEVPSELNCKGCFFLQFRQDGSNSSKSCMMISTCSKYVRPDHQDIIYK